MFTASSASTAVSALSTTLPVLSDDHSGLLGLEQLVMDTPPPPPISIGTQQHQSSLLNNTSVLNQSATNVHAYQQQLQQQHSQQSMHSHPSHQLTVPRVIHYIHSEWRRYEADRADWMRERSELQLKVDNVTSELEKKQSHVEFLERRLAMLEQALLDERSGNNNGNSNSNKQSQSQSKVNNGQQTTDGAQQIKTIIEEEEEENEEEKATSALSKVKASDGVKDSSLVKSSSKLASPKSRFTHRISAMVDSFGRRSVSNPSKSQTAINEAASGEQLDVGKRVVSGGVIAQQQSLSIASVTAGIQFERQVEQAIGDRLTTTAAHSSHSSQNGLAQSQQQQQQQQQQPNAVKLGPKKTILIRPPSVQKSNSKENKSLDVNDDIDNDDAELIRMPSRRESRKTRRITIIPPSNFADEQPQQHNQQQQQNMDDTMREESISFDFGDSADSTNAPSVASLSSDVLAHKRKSLLNKINRAQGRYPRLSLEAEQPNSESSASPPPLPSHDLLLPSSSSSASSSLSIPHELAPIRSQGMNHRSSPLSFISSTSVSSSSPANSLSSSSPSSSFQTFNVSTSDVDGVAEDVWLLTQHCVATASSDGVCIWEVVSKDDIADDSSDDDDSDDEADADFSSTLSGELRFRLYRTFDVGGYGAIDLCALPNHPNRLLVSRRSTALGGGGGGGGSSDTDDKLVSPLVIVDLQGGSNDVHEVQIQWINEHDSTAEHQLTHVTLIPSDEEDSNSSSAAKYRILASCLSRFVRAFDLDIESNLATEISSIAAHDDQAASVDIDPSSRFFATVGSEGALRQWSLPSPASNGIACVQDIAAHRDQSNGEAALVVRYHPSVFAGIQTWLASGGADGIIRVFSCELPQSSSSPAPPNSSSLSSAPSS
ncbi:hypothetical protein GQ42DRAFT_152294 [Ramicandelaber brevisporus]|nr:hypothetical protein GQ42DRAFT_152294 [Ramicandelaber brevisporus]